MKNIPTPYELGQEFAELQKVLAKAEGESLAAMLLPRILWRYQLPYI